uniref:Uncharacterized protein n=1 Tax=Physcomitrium patens TaxID=3218 RepID=A0A7I4AEA6_PHYPA
MSRKYVLLVTFLTYHQNAEVEKKDLKVALLEAKNAQFVQELVEQQKLITRMKRRIDDKENLCSSQFQLEMMNGRMQDLKAARKRIKLEFTQLCKIEHVQT